VYACLGKLHNPAGALLGAIEKLEKVLQLAWVFVLYETMCPARRVSRPAEHGLTLVELVLLARNECLPGLNNPMLM
jgi:hypothetical protein